MAMSKTKVKVRVADLLAAVEARRESALKAHQKALDSYPGELEKWNQKVIAALEAALEKAKKGNPPVSYGEVRIREIGYKPTKPEGLNVANIDRLIATLKMAADESISISADDASEYLG